MPGAAGNYTQLATQGSWGQKHCAVINCKTRQRKQILDMEIAWQYTFTVTKVACLHLNHTFFEINCKCQRASVL